MKKVTIIEGSYACHPRLRRSRWNRGRVSKLTTEDTE